jgi:hypothetical protein
MALVNKFLLHQPLNRQGKTYAREGELRSMSRRWRIGSAPVG